MIPDKTHQWLARGTTPQRLLLSGENSWEVALHMASQLQGELASRIEKGAHPDTRVFRDNGKSFKIDFSQTAKTDGQDESENVRGLVRWISQKPVSPHRIVILENLERCSREAPQALLKIIEEPPPKAIFLFTTQNHYQILGTILSRITVLTIPPSTSPQVDHQALAFLESQDLILQFQVIESLDKEAKNTKDRNILPIFVKNLISVARTDTRFQAKLEGLLQAHNDLRSNLNHKLVLEHLVLTWQT
ncbi:MAG TPA: hypothetical protein VIT68_05270 [Candidatus Gracilibacteria bacterium]